MHHMELVKSYELPSMAMDVVCMYKKDDPETLDGFITCSYDGSIRIFGWSNPNLSDLHILNSVKIGVFPLLKMSIKDSNYVVVVGDSSNFFVFHKTTGNVVKTQIAHEM